MANKTRESGGIRGGEIGEGGGDGALSLTSAMHKGPSTKPHGMYIEHTPCKHNYVVIDVCAEAARGMQTNVIEVPIARHIIKY